nr:iron-containing alcohol dehydrogenase [Paenalcaligenes hominis]
MVPDNRNLRLPELIQSSTRSVLNKPLLYTLPTTSGTGSEVTPFATIWDHANKKKLSLTGMDVFPSMALVDADLTETVPIHTVLYTGLDTINQAAESIWNKNANPVTLSYAYKALQLAMHALPRLIAGTCKATEKEYMAEASTLAGLAISHTRTALCHSISYPLTAHFGVPHGLACAFTMPAVLRHNIQAEDGRFAELGLRLTGSTSLDALLLYFSELHEVLNVRQRVKSYIPGLNELLSLQTEMVTVGRADNNLCDYPDLEKIIREAWGD